jgi:hypothetical protein
LREKLKQRSEFEYYLISDHKQSIVIPEIRKIDKAARFIWLLRDPKSCAESCFVAGFYTGASTKWEKTIVRPYFGFPDGFKQNRYMMILWYWKEINKTIERSLMGADFKAIHIKHLGDKVFNSREERAAKFGREVPPIREMNEVEKEYYDNYIVQYWNYLKGEYLE